MSLGARVALITTSVCVAVCCVGPCVAYFALGLFGTALYDAAPR